MTPEHLAQLEALQNFLTGASSRPTTQGLKSTEERLLAERCHLLPGCANDNGATAENVAPTSGDAK
jgi:hypothetical protein